jgi:multidrug resistance protein MdtO
MATVAAPSGSSGFFSWFREFLRRELAPYPGRGVTVARMVISATITMILIMTFRIPSGALAVLYAFLVSRDNLRSTINSGIAIAVSYSIGVLFVLTGANLFADQPFGRFLWFAGAIFVVFFAQRSLRDFGVATGFSIVVIDALPIWQAGGTAEHRVELTLWQVLAVAIGTLVTISVEAVFHALHSKDELFQGLDERLAVVYHLIQSYGRKQPVTEDVANRLAQYTIVGVSGLRRVLGQSRHERLYRDQLTAVVALTGRLIDLAATSARTPHQLRDGDESRLMELASQIEQIRASIATSQIPSLPSETYKSPSGISLLSEMERTISLIPRVFAGSESIDAYFPSVLDQEDRSGFFVSDAFRNPAHIQFALRGCLAATLCYFTYEILNWDGLATSVTTCVITALSNAGTSRQKQLLRIAGAGAGGFLFGIGSQIFILPNIDSITEFALLFAAVTAVGAWFASSSQRLSYFGIQLALAFYLITLQEFTIQTSLAIARDRVVGILLGLCMMWLVFDRLGNTSAAEQMVRAFTQNLRAIADLAMQPGKESPTEAIRRIRVLREEIGVNFQTVNAQADAVPFEFGRRREQEMAARSLIRAWQPKLRTLYLMEAALLQHRVFGADMDLPAAFRDAQIRFNQECASVLRHMADHLEVKPPASDVELDVFLKSLSQSLSVLGSTLPSLTKAQGVSTLSRHIRDQLTELSQDVCGRDLSSP